MMNFNSHAHVERDGFIHFPSTNNMNFNSHAHVERDQFDKEAVRGILISTHTLTWSVTIEVATKYLKRMISTHTLTWSVTI